MFELEDAINAWRSAQRGAGESLREEDLDELESHLRDQVTRLRSTGAVDDSEAFLLARRRLGDVTMLGNEFAKSDLGTLWVRRYFWMLSGFILLSFIGMLGGLAGRVASAGAVLAPGGSPVVATVGGAVITALTIAGLIWLAVRHCKNGGGPFRGAARLAQNHPSAFVIAIAVLPAVVWAADLVVNVMLVRLSGPSELGQMAITGQYTRLATGVVLLAALALGAVVLLKLGWGRRPAAAG